MMPTTRYAERTEVPVRQSRSEIESLLEGYGVTDYTFGKLNGNPTVLFEWRGRRIRLHIPLPDPDDAQFTTTPGRRYMRTRAEAKKAYDQEVMRLWRGLVLILKAKLVAVDTGIATLDEEFLGYEVTSEGQSVLEETYRQGIVRQLPAGRTVVMEG